MPRFCANFNFLFLEVPLLDRFEAAAKAGFKGVEIGNPYEASAADIAARLKANGLTLALINTTAGDAKVGERGRSALAGREKDFDADLANALAYCEATGCKLVHVMAGLVHQGARRDTFVANLKKA
ncbi:MAG TPA: TIM barrel protein, partial [Hyphomicrobiaceae bacterium]